MHHLIVQHRFAKNLALAGIGDGRVDHPVQAAQRRGGGEQPFFLKLHHLHGEPGAFLPDHVAHRHAHVIKEQLRSVRTIHPDLVDLLLVDSGRIHRHHDQRLVLMNPPVAGIGQQATPIGLKPVGDPHLGPVDHEIIAIPPRCGADTRHVRPGTGFADTQTPDHLARDRGRKKLAFQLFRPKPGQSRSAHIGLNTDRHRHAAASRGPEGFGHDHGISEIQPHAAIGRVVFDAKQAQLAHLGKDVVRGIGLGGLPFIHMGIDLGFNEFRHQLIKLFVVICPLHGILPSQEFPAFGNKLPDTAWGRSNVTLGQNPRYLSRTVASPSSAVLSPDQTT